MFKSSSTEAKTFQEEAILTTSAHIQKVQLSRPLKDFNFRETISLPLSCPPLLPLSHCVHPALLSSRWRPAKRELVFLKGTASGDFYEELRKEHIHANDG